MRGNYYQTQSKADTRPYFYIIGILIVILLLGIVGQCQYREEQEIQPLTREQRAEIMSRQSEFDREQHIGLADRILAAWVEREWRERQ
jgi:hypothetical protein